MVDVSLILMVSDCPSADCCDSASIAEVRPTRCCTEGSPADPKSATYYDLHPGALLAQRKHPSIADVRPMRCCTDNTRAAPELPQNQPPITACVPARS